MHFIHHAMIEFVLEMRIDEEECFILSKRDLAFQSDEWRQTTMVQCGEFINCKVPALCAVQSPIRSICPVGLKIHFVRSGRTMGYNSPHPHQVQHLHDFYKSTKSVYLHSGYHSNGFVAVQVRCLLLGQKIDANKIFDFVRLFIGSKYLAGMSNRALLRVHRMHVTLCTPSLNHRKCLYLDKNQGWIITWPIPLWAVMDFVQLQRWISRVFDVAWNRWISKSKIIRKGLIISQYTHSAFSICPKTGISMKAA